MKVVRTVATVVAVVAQIAAVVAPFTPLAPLAPVFQLIAVGAAAIAAVSNYFIMRRPASGPGGATDFKADPSAGVPMIVGRTGVGGNIIHQDSFGKDRKFQSFVIAWSGAGPVEQIESFSADYTVVNFDGTGEATGYYDGLMWLDTQLGATPEATALASSQGSLPGWGAAYKMSGYAAGLWTLKYDVSGDHNYINGVPKPLCVIKGVKVYDPRLDSTYPGGSGPCRANDESTFVYSENPFLHALQFAMGRFQNGKRVIGIGLALAGVNVAAYVEAANIADANGWKVGGQVWSTEDKWDRLKAMMQAGSGVPIRLGAQLSCIVDAPRVSLATVTAADLAGEATVVATQPRRARINGVVARYRSEAHNWEVVPAERVQVPLYVSEDGGERTREIDFPLVQDVDQAAQLAAYEVVNAREFGPISLPLKLKWIGYKPGDCVTVDIPELGLNNQLCLILARTLDPASGVVSFEMRSETTAKHDFALGKTGVAPPTPGVTPPDYSVVPAPIAGSWTATGGTVASAAGQVPAIIIVGACDNLSADSIIFEYRPVGSTDWIVAGTDTPQTTRKEIPGLPPNKAYDVAISYTVRGITGARLIITPVTTGEWLIIGDLSATLSVASVQVPADYFGVVTDYTPTRGRWIITAGTVDITSLFTITTAPSGNPQALSVTYAGSQYEVTAGFDTLENTADLMMRATGSGAYAAVTFDRNLHLTKLKAATAVDPTPPAIPSGLALTSSIRVDDDGTQKTFLVATWNANTEPDLAYYRLLLREAGGNFVTYQVGGTRFEVQVLAGVTYEARLQAVDVAGNVSATYPSGTTVVSHTTGTDTAAPSAPTGFSANAGLRLINLLWTNPAATDLDHVDIYENTTNASGSATRIASVKAENGQPGFFSRDNLATGVQRFYWLKAVDTSGNASAFSGGANATTGFAVTADFAVGTLNGDRILAGSIFANKLFVSGNATQDALPAGITIGVSGTTIGTVDTRAADPIVQANTKTTKLAPGLVLISGSTTLADWRNGGDNTKIEGGAIAANTITANKVSIGLRGIDIGGIEFTANWDITTGLAALNKLSWSAGTIVYADDAGTMQFASIPQGVATYGSTALYVYWVKGATTLSTTTSAATANGANNVVLATWQGGTDLVVNYGRTIIDGSKITTGTVNANTMIAGTITSRELSTGALLTTTAQIGTATVERLNIKGLGQITVPNVTTAADTSIPSGGTGAGTVTTILTTSSVTVGDGVYGVAIVTFSAWVDSGSQTDGAARVTLELNINGAGFSQVATADSGARVSGGDVYFRIPVALTYITSTSAQTVQARIKAQSIVMNGANGSRNLTIRNPVVVIQGGAR